MTAMAEVSGSTLLGNGPVNTFSTVFRGDSRGTILQFSFRATCGSFFFPIGLFLNRLTRLGVGLLADGRCSLYITLLKVDRWQLSKRNQNTSRQ